MTYLGSGLSLLLYLHVYCNVDKHQSKEFSLGLVVKIWTSQTSGLVFNSWNSRHAVPLYRALLFTAEIMYKSSNVAALLSLTQLSFLRYSIGSREGKREKNISLYATT